MPSIKENNNYTFISDAFLKSRLLRVLIHNEQTILTELWYKNSGKGTISFSTIYETVDNPIIRFIIYGYIDNPTIFLDNLRLIIQ